MTPDEVIELVHQIDDLEDERKQLQEKIGRLKERLAAATGGGRKVGAIRRVPLRAEGKRQRTSPLKQVAIRHIQDNPRADYGSLVVALYGKSTPKAIKNARTMIFHMRKAGIIEGDPGSWKVRPLSAIVDEDVEAAVV